MDSINVKHALTLGSVVVAAQDQVSSDLASETIVLSLETGRYYGLDRLGARIWQLVHAPARVADIRDAIVAEYEDELDRCERDLLNFLQQLIDRGLVETRDGTDS